QHPAQKHGKDLVGIHEVAVLVDRSDAVGVAVGAEASVAMVLHHRVFKGLDVRFNWLGVDSRKERVDVAADLDVIHPEARKDFGQDGAAGAIHGVDGELEAGLRNQIKVGEALDGLEVVGQKVEEANFGGLGGAGNGLAEEAF